MNLRQEIRPCLRDLPSLAGRGSSVSSAFWPALAVTKLKTKSSLAFLARMMFISGISAATIFSNQAVQAEPMPEGWGRINAEQAKMVNFGMFSGQIVASCTFARFGHLPPSEARKAIRASLDLAIAKYGKSFAKAVGWNVRRTSLDECSALWPAGYWQYFPDKPFSLH